MARPTLKQILDALRSEVLVGKAYLELAQGLLAADPVVLETARTFFGLTVNGSLELAQMSVARIYDRTRGAVTIRSMLDEARGQLTAFKNATPKEAEAAILKATMAVDALQPILESIRNRRNAWLAHLDPRTVADPKALGVKAKLTIPDLEQAFQKTEKILVELYSRFEGVFGELRFIDGDDYNMALDWIRSAKCTFFENYEKEFGHPLDGPRPRTAQIIC